MPSRLLRTSVGRNDEAFLGCYVDNQISIYLPAIHTSNLVSFSLVLFTQTRLVPSSNSTHISLPFRLILRSRHAPMPRASASDLLAFSAQPAASRSAVNEPASISSFIHTHIAVPPRLPLRPRHEPMQHATTSDLLAFPHKQQPLSRPPGTGFSMSSAASICA
jgi:hypothetical protein